MGRSWQSNGAGGCPRGRQEIDIARYGRVAAGLCVLSVVLVFGGFGQTVATADTEPDPPPAETHESGEPTPDVGQLETEPAGTTATPAEADTLPSLLGAFDSATLFGAEQQDPEPTQNARTEGQQQSPGLTGPMALGATTVNESPPPPATVQTTDNSGSDAVGPTATEVVNEPEVPPAVVSSSPSTEPSSAPEAPAQTQQVPAADPPAQPLAEQPVVGEVAVIEEPQAPPAPAEEAQLIGAAAPATDIVGALAYLFMALTHDSGSILSIPNGLLSLLGFSPMGEAATATVNAGGIGGGLFAASLYSAVRTQLTSPRPMQEGWPELLRDLGDSNSLTADAPRAAAVASATAVKEDHLSVALADSIVPEQVRSVLRHTVGAVLAPLSLLVLALMASPGVAGLILLASAGTFVGYRQAKAASILRAVGIARFAKSGPLGVVTSGGLVTMRSRRSPRVDEQAAGAAPLESIA